jgi:SAM-dependent methyltransferase
MTDPSKLFLVLLLAVSCSHEATGPASNPERARGATAASEPAATSAEPIASAAPAASAEPVASAAPSASAEPAASEEPLPDKWERVPDIEYVPTPQNVVDKMLEVAAVTKDDVVYDLGCGDGRILVTAAKKYGAKGFGYDLDPKRVREARDNVKKNNVGHLVKIELKDIFLVDIRSATVVTLYLLPELNVKLIPQLETLVSGSRIVSHDFDMAGVEPEQKLTVLAPDHRPPHKDREHYVYLWKTPLKKTPPKGKSPKKERKKQ